MVDTREPITRTNQQSGADAPETSPQPTARMQSSPMARGAQLATEQGKTSIADSVVAKIAGIAAREISGVHELSSSGAGSLVSGLTQKVTGSDNRSQGVSVEVGEREAAIDLTMTVDYGVSIPQVAEAVRRNVMNRVQSMTGLTVKEVNIDVTDLFFPEDAKSAQTEKRVE